MKKRILVALLCGMVSLSMAACGNTDVENVMEEEPINSETQEPIVNETQEPIVTETQEPIISETQEPINSEQNTSTPAPEQSSSTSTPAPEQSSSSSVAPSTPDGHISVSQGSTGTTSFGTTYPILSAFNTIALDPNSIGWTNNDDVPDEYTNVAGEANRALGKAVGSLESTGVAFTLDGTNNIISCGSAWVERQPSKGQYLFVYGTDLSALSDGGALSREIIKVMLGTSVTSTPIEVESALWEDCYGDYEQFSLGTWVTVGECLIQYVYGDADTHVYQYAIRAKQ